jgi:STE24 endopeptidase
MPLFNKFTPLEEGELKTRIEEYARSRNFKIKGVFTMDASRRSTKSNAYFTGFGRFRRIVLFDTLIKRHTIDELLSILAHEVGHYKKRHIMKNVLVSVLSTGLMFFILSLFINNRDLFDAFQMSYTSIYASLFFFAFLYGPIDMIVSIIGNLLSRRFEYEADSYAALTRGQPGAMIASLKKLSVDNLSNLTPHPLKVFLTYSHPPVLERLRALDRFRSGSDDSG